MIHKRDGDIRLLYTSDMPKIMKILLKDRTTRRNIVWAISAYASYGKNFQPNASIQYNAVSNGGDIFLKPRIKKNEEVRRERTKIRAEVFTPTWVVKNQIDLIEENYKDLSLDQYISMKWIEVACGEGPYICNRYDMDTGELIPLMTRTGFLDRKLQRLMREIDNKNVWISYAIKAFKACYGYEFQGDSLLIARENIFHSFIDYFLSKFNETPDQLLLETIAKIISYNIFQMDGLKCVVPYSGKDIEKRYVQLSFFEEMERKEKIYIVDRGIKARIKDWSNDRMFDFQDLLNGRKSKMKFDAVIGNPPYNDEARQQIYTDFYVQAIEIGKNVCLIFPTGWQEPKNANNLSKMNNAKVKRDSQIVSITNIKNAFSNTPGAQSTNIILWKEGYDNGLEGEQLIIEDEGVSYKMLPIKKSDLEKPKFIVELAETVNKNSEFQSITKIVSKLKPYGLRTDIIKEPVKYGLPPLADNRKNETDIRVFTPYGFKYVSYDYPFPKKGHGFDYFKVFVPYAWGNWKEETGLGGAFSDIFVAKPGDACIETYLECGAYSTQEEAYKLAKYMMTPFFRALLYMNKYSQHSTSAFGAIPIQSFEESWWNLSVEEVNDNLFDKYKVSDLVKKQVVESIQQKTEENIVLL